MSTFPQFNKPGIDLFYDLVNKTNTTSFRVGDLILGLPAVGAHPEHSFVNTIIQVSGTDRVAFKGPQPLHYRRIDIGLLLSQENLSFSLPEGTTNFTTADVLPLVNARFQIRLEAADVVSGSWTADPDADQNIVLEIAASSLTYTNQVTLKILKAGDVPEPAADFEFNRTAILSETIPVNPDEPLHEVLKMATNHFLITSNTTIDNPFGIPMTMGIHPQFINPKVSYTLNGMIHVDELHLSRTYGPAATGGIYEGYYVFNDSMNLTSLSVKAELDASSAESWSRSTQVGAVGSFGRWLSSADLAELGYIPELSATDIPEGKSSVEFSVNITPKVAVMGAGFVFSRLDNRRRLPTNAALTSLYAFANADSGETYMGAGSGGEAVDGLLTLTDGGIRKCTIYQNPTNLKLWQVEMENANDAAVTLRFSGNPPAKLTITALSGPFQIVPDYDDGSAPIEVTTVGQVVDLPDLYAPKFLVTNSTTTKFSVGFELALMIRDESQTELDSMLEVNFSIAKLNNANGQVDLGAPVRKMMPCSTWRWQMPAHNKTIIAATTDRREYWHGFFALASDLTVYIDRYTDDPSSGGDTSSPIPTKQVGWVPLGEILSRTVGRDVPTTFDVKTEAGYTGTYTPASYLEPRFVVSLPTGMLFESTQVPYNRDTPINWVYFDHNAPTVVGHGKIFMFQTLAIKLVDQLVDDHAMIYMARTQYYGNDGEQWALGIDMQGKPQFDDIAVLTVESTAPMFAAYNSNQHAGKYCRVRFETGETTPTELEWADLPVNTGKIRLYRADIIGQYNTNIGMVCVHEDGRVWWCMPRLPTDYPWKSLPNADFGPGGFEAYVPLTISEDGNFLRSVMGSSSQPADAISNIEWRGDGSDSEIIADYDITGRMIPKAQQPNWTRKFEHFRYQYNGGRGTKVVGLYMADDQRTFLKYTAPTWVDMGDPPPPV